MWESSLLNGALGHWGEARPYVGLYDPHSVPEGIHEVSEPYSFSFLIPCL